MKYTFAFFINYLTFENYKELDTILRDRKPIVVKLPGMQDEFEFQFFDLKAAEHEVKNENYHGFFVYSAGHGESPALSKINQDKLCRPIFLVMPMHQTAQTPPQNNSVLVDVTKLKEWGSVMSGCWPENTAPSPGLQAFIQAANNALNELFIEITKYAINLLQKQPVSFAELYTHEQKNSCFRPKQTLTVESVRVQQITQFSKALDLYRDSVLNKQNESEDKKNRVKYIEDLKEFLTQYFTDTSKPKVLNIQATNKNLEALLKVKLDDGVRKFKSFFNWFSSDGNRLATLLESIPKFEGGLDKAFVVKATSAAVVSHTLVDTKADAKTAPVVSAASTATAAAGIDTKAFAKALAPTSSATTTSVTSVAAATSGVPGVAAAGVATLSATTASKTPKPTSP